MIFRIVYNTKTVLKLILIQMKKSDNNHNKSLKYSFNLDQLNKVGNNDEEFTIQMLKQFRFSATECSGNLVSAIKQKDGVKLKSAAHKAVPSYSVMGLDELVDLLKTIERWPEVNFDNLTTLIRLFNKKNQKVITEINNYINEIEEIKVSI
jgi:hypothetical protein